MAPIALICSVQLEADPLLRIATETAPLDIRSMTGWNTHVGGAPVILIVGGMGKTNAARSLTALIENQTVSGVIGFGVAGAYQESALEVGEVALANIEHYGDEGVEAPEGWMSTEGIGIPLLDLPGNRRFNDFPISPGPLAAARQALDTAGIPARVGPFVTLSTCSGTSERGARIAKRYGALCETMEGAAYAHVSAIYGIPFLELRGISNLVEDRDLSRWDLTWAANATAAALSHVLAVSPFSSEERASR